MLRCLFAFLCAAQGSSETGWKEGASVLDWHTYVMLAGEQSHLPPVPMTVNTSLLLKGYQSLVQQRFFELPWHKIVISHRNILDICKGTRAVQQDAALQTHLGDCSSVRRLQWCCCCCTDSPAFFFFYFYFFNSAAVTMKTCGNLVYRGIFYVTFWLFSCYFVSLTENSCSCRFIPDITVIRSDSQPLASLSEINNAVTNHGLYFQDSMLKSSVVAFLYTLFFYRIINKSNIILLGSS